MGNRTSNPDAAPARAPVSPCSTEDPVDQDAATALEPAEEPEPVAIENSDEFEQVLTCIFWHIYPFLIFDCGCPNMYR